MAELTVIRWRDIPMQVVARGEGGTARRLLPDRFQEAVDASAMVDGLIGSDDYTAQMVMDRRGCGEDLEAEVQAEADPDRGRVDRRGPARDDPGRRDPGRRRRLGAARGGLTVADTVLSSATKEVVIGSGRPFVVIGERINPTGRAKLAEEMKAGDFSTVVADVAAQVEAGAHMLDVNAGIPLADEPAILAETVRLVQSLTDVPLSIDSSIVAALEAGLDVYEGKALVNSVTGEEERLEVVLPLVAKHGAAVVAISNDETGISEDPDVRFEVAKKIVRRAADHGIDPADVVVDPLVMPVGAMGTAGRQVFRLVRRLHDELGVNTTCGASNISFGLPNRGRDQRRVPGDGDRERDDERDHVADVRGRAPGGDGRRRPHGQRRARGGVDPHLRGPWRRRRPCRRWPPPGRARGAGGRGRRGRRGDPDLHREHRRGFARRLHPVGPPRAVRRRDLAPRRRARAGRRSRLGLRRARDLRPLPGRPDGGRVPEAPAHVVGDAT